MPLSAAIAIPKVRLRRAKLVKRFNKQKLMKYLEMYAVDATLRDPDLSPIVGKSNMRDYLTEHFAYSRTIGSPQIRLRSKKTVIRGTYIHDSGEYYWSTVYCGRYVHKWAWIKDNYYLISDRFTIETTLP